MASSKLVEVDKGYQAFLRRLNKLGKKELTVGVHNEEGKRQYDNGISVLEVANIHEFGAPSVNIPQRSWFRGNMDKNGQKYMRMLERGTAKVVKGKEDGDRLKFKIGETIRKDIIDRIRSRIPPPNAESTVEAKGSDIPLIDSGTFLRSIKSKVK